MNAFLIENIEKTRRVWKVTKKRMAELLDLKEMAMISITKGKRKPEVEMMIKLEELTGISVRDLYTREIDKSEIPSHPLSSYPVKKEILNPNVKEGIKVIEKALSKIKDHL